jgi:hypothetical protein
LIHLKPLNWVGGSIIFLNLRWLEIQGPTHPLQVMGKGFDSSWITSPLRGALSVRLVIEGAIIIIVPFVMPFSLEAVSLLVPIFNLAVHVSVTDGDKQVTVILITPSTTLL